MTNFTHQIVMEDLKNWSKPLISVLNVNMTRDVCADGKLLPGNDGTTDSTTGNVCGS